MGRTFYVKTSKDDRGNDLVPPLFRVMVESEESQDGFRRAGGISEAPIEDDGFTHNVFLGYGTHREPEKFKQHVGEYPTLGKAIHAARVELGHKEEDD